MTQTQRSYQAFLKAAKSQLGISHREAQRMYKGVKERLERAPRAKDLKEHPRIAKQEAKKAGAKPAPAKPAKEKREKRAPEKEAPEKKRRERSEDIPDDYEFFEDPLEAEY
jgi:hypothetical protein